MKKVAILGAEGFLGKSISEFFVEKSDVELLLVARSFATEDERVQQITCDYRETDKLVSLVGGADVVIMAISMLVPSSSDSLKSGMEKCTYYDCDFVEKISQLEKKPKVIFLSSGGTIYGEISDSVSELSDTSPCSIYGLTKLITEKFIQLQSSNTGLKYCIARVSNPYGKLVHNPKKNQGLIPAILKSYQKDRVFEVWGDGEMVRDYIHISDLVSAVYKMLDDYVTGVYNLGSGVGTSINQILEIINNNTEKHLEVGYIETISSAHVEKNILDISKIQKELDWNPTLSIEGGIKKLLQEYGIK